ncbi:hypothetical protein GH733_016653 [Mirounga leonina]|nr:hypothetical protein GH733_016653 [Mirounga leonina]
MGAVLGRTSHRGDERGRAHWDVLLVSQRWHPERRRSVLQCPWDPKPRFRQGSETAQRATRPSTSALTTFGDSGALKDLVMELKPFIVQTKETQGGNVICSQPQTLSRQRVTEWLFLGSGETDFGPQIKNLNKKLFTVVAWDPRGYGHSRPPDRDFPVDFFERDAKDAVDLMKTLKFKKVSLLGWSDGGITSLIAAAKYPSFINKMVIWGANAYVTDEDEKIYQGRSDTFVTQEKVLENPRSHFRLLILGAVCLAGNICGHLLPLIQCPTLIVHGEKDPLVPRFHADFIHKHVRGSR